MKKKIMITIIIVSLIIIGVGIFMQFNNKSKPIEDKKVIELTIEEATNLLYKTYPLDNALNYNLKEENNESFIFVREDEDVKRDYIVNKKTKNIDVAYYAE